MGINPYLHRREFEENTFKAFIYMHFVTKECSILYISTNFTYLHIAKSVLVEPDY